MSRWQDFERIIETSFEGYERAGIAIMSMMPVPTKAISGRSGAPIRVQTGKAPFDAYGFLLDGGRFIGLEIKSTAKRESSIEIKSDGGVREHQLMSLASVAKAGGIAKIVWENCGEIGILDEDEIIVAWHKYDAAISNRNPIRGTKSIQWSLFRKVEWGSVGGCAAPLWLGDRPEDKGNPKVHGPLDGTRGSLSG